jgi:probable F420-dependent oxidoreductase
VKFALEMPTAGATTDPAAIKVMAQAADQAGFELVGYTDHPAPSRKWLDHGGHSTFDPFAALSFVAAVTERVGLMTYLAVLPYRNPLLLAKSVATVDRLSGGRFTLVAGTGYLRSEFAALGRSFEDRNKLFDEAVTVLRGTFSDAAFEFDGRDFTALGVALDPPPVQKPHPPIWVGGNSIASRRRVARFGAGWAPVRSDPTFSQTMRTGVLSTDDDVATAIDGLREMVVAEGRDPDQVGVMLDGGPRLEDPSDFALERAGQLARIGATHVMVHAPTGEPAQIADHLERFGREVIAAAG